MKNLLLILFIIVTSFISHSQDTIRTKSNEILVGTVKEITDVTLTYTRFDQPDGPLRTLNLHQVSEISYSNGTKETIRVASAPSNVPTSKPMANESNWKPGTINNTGKTVIIRRRGPDYRIRPGQRFPSERGSVERVLDNGIYLDGMIGYGTVLDIKSKLGNSNSVTEEFVAFGVRFGSKFYFGVNEKRKFGLNMAWVRLTGGVGEYTNSHIFFSPVNFGPCASFKLSDKMGLETNTFVGMVASSVYQNSIGINYGLDVKWRYDALAIGIDYARSDNIYGGPSENSNIFSISVGVKF